jgi:hypothetical protein
LSSPLVAKKTAKITQLYQFNIDHSEFCQNNI